MPDQPARDLLSIAAADGRSSRKLAVLNAAIELFAARGYDRVTVRDIGDRLQMTGPSLYRHYTSKGDLLADAVTLVAGAMIGELRKIVASPESPAARLDTAIRFHVDFALRHRDYLLVYFREARRLSGPIRTAHRRQASAYRSMWVDLLLEAGVTDERQEAELLYALLVTMLNVGSPAQVDLADTRTVDLIVDRASALLTSHP
jgi:AcrR family transcriptional regulator